MSHWTTETEARQQIKELVAAYYRDFKEQKNTFVPGDRINYAARDLRSNLPHGSV